MVADETEKIITLSEVKNILKKVEKDRKLFQKLRIFLKKLKKIEKN
jgi:DNA-directed RNA polymerase subunit F